jgi:hypothetical protein
MTTDDTGQSDPYGLPVSWDGEQLLGELPGQPQDSKPELDANGLPIQDQPAKDPTISLATSSIACLILGAVSAWIAITYQVSHHKLAGNLTGPLGGAAGILAFISACAVWVFLRNMERKMEKIKYRGAIAGILTVGWLLGAIGYWVLYPPTGSS